MNASLAKGFSALLICLRRFNNLNMSDEPEAALVLRANERLVVAVVAERPPGCVNAAAERSFGYNSTVPDGIDQLILADNPIMVAYQVNDKIEDLRFDMNEFATPAQLLLAEVDLDFGELEFQYCLGHTCASVAKNPGTPSLKTHAFQTKRTSLKMRLNFIDGSALVQYQRADLSGCDVRYSRQQT